MIINEFDPISHDQNEISWEYHWHDFVSFNRQYGDNVNSDNKAAKCPLMTFDDSDDQSEEFDPLTHVDNEIPWEYHWYDFVTFTRQYGCITATE
ncbi:hypothetical protein DERP_014779 [Dermatophagoides pteronyssinus]|uniref:Uncharacterized protein n=1 Tax=Dermatophagoides pteronyssinus TaxID=6956 RepID=A0ABQ8J2D8_DERPT|nr:hypothetical protein DERP_014779 [Dermatophagoides pteronyssinus]